jgi:hypothetical protein
MASTVRKALLFSAQRFGSVRRIASFSTDGLRTFWFIDIEDDEGKAHRAKINMGYFEYPGPLQIVTASRASVRVGGRRKEGDWIELTSPEDSLHSIYASDKKAIDFRGTIKFEFTEEAAGALTFDFSANDQQLRALDVGLRYSSALTVDPTSGSPTPSGALATATYPIFRTPNGSSISLSALLDTYDPFDDNILQKIAVRDFDYTTKLFPAGFKPLEEIPGSGPGRFGGSISGGPRDFHQRPSNQIGV